MTENAPADWYLDPEDTTQLRYWNGETWTEHRSPRVPPPETHAPAPTSPAFVGIDAPASAPATTATESASTPPSAAVFPAEPAEKPAEPGQASAVAVSRTYWLNPNGSWPSVEVVGEAYRDDQIIAVIGRRPKADDEIELREIASLIPEPDNPYDRNAISVRIKERVVGYLSKEDAKRYKPFIDRVVSSGHVPRTNASIWAVLRKTYDGKQRLYSNVRLALNEPHLLLPVNEAPADPYSIVPWGGGLQVTGEDKHFDVLKPFVSNHDREIMIVTLHRGVEAKPRGDREYVEVRLNGQRVGEMSTATSKHFFPIIDHLQEKGLVTAAWAHLKGSSLTAEVVLQATKASEIEDAWLQGEAVTLPDLVPAATTYYVPPAYSGPKRAAPSTKPAKPKAKAKSPQPAPTGFSLSNTPAKSGCAVILLAGVAATIAVPVVSHFI